MGIWIWLIVRILRSASWLGNAVNIDLSGWIRVLPVGPFSASGRFPFVLNGFFIDSASAQKRSGRSLFSLFLMPEKESTVLMEGKAATSMPGRGTRLHTHFALQWYRRERDFRCRHFRHAGERRCVRRDRRRMALRLAEGSTIRSDDRHVHGRFAGAARPSGSMAFGQEPASFRLQNCNEFSDADHCLILVALLRG